MKATLRILSRIVGVLLLLILLYFVAAVVGSIIPVNRSTGDPQGDVEIFFRTNGVHTSIVAPVQNQEMDWREVLDFAHTISNRTNYDYVSFGWGDLEFYQNTPQWSDLTISTAFKALFLETPSALNIEYFEGPIAADEDTVAVRISAEQYRLLCRYILDSFKYDQNDEVIVVPGLHYNYKDAFYRAERHMNIFYTCNTWTNNGLKSSELRACLWTPFDKGIFFQYR